MLPILRNCSFLFVLQSQPFYRAIGNFNDPLPTWVSDWHCFFFFLLGMCIIEKKKKQQKKKKQVERLLKSIQDMWNSNRAPNFEVVNLSAVEFK